MQLFLAEVVAPRDSVVKGHVYTIEIIPELYDFSKKIQSLRGIVI